VLGVDVSQVAVDVATEAARGYLAAGRYEYRRASFSATGLPDGCADGVVAIEALPMAPDRAAALAEVHRVLRPGGRATFTGGERRGPAGNGAAFRWAPLIEAAGLDLVSSHVDEARGRRWLAVCALQLEHEAELRAGLGDLAEDFLQEARAAPANWGVPGLVGVQFVVRRPISRA
jgi:SAM-dependent methyltransferase